MRYSSITTTGTPVRKWTNSSITTELSALQMIYWKPYYQKSPRNMTRHQQASRKSATSVGSIELRLCQAKPLTHPAHMNLREAFLPYKDLIAQVIMDKNPKITTVINKTEDVGSESVFRTFPYEVLAGPDDLNVEVSDSNCIFQFDFGKVYWNSRLNTEHNRIIAKFGSGEAVCDVMAGVGPFAVPAGKQGVFVWANDLNPHCYEALQWAIKRNKVVDFVTARCADGRDFIRSSTEDLRMMTHSASFEVPRRSGQSQPQQENSHRPLSPQAKRKLSKTYTNLTQPQTFSHFVMNLPATAVTFLNAFRGLYRGHEADFTPTTAQQLPTDFTPFTSSQQLPMIHVYLFTTRHDDPKQEHEEVCEVVSKHLGSKITPDMEGVELFDVRLVSPKKRMYCASFRLPPEVAFAAA